MIRVATGLKVSRSLYDMSRAVASADGRKSSLCSSGFFNSAVVKTSTISIMRARARGDWRVSETLSGCANTRGSVDRTRVGADLVIPCRSD